MNLSHLRATLWLRWRILRNRIRRGGKLSNVLLAVLLVIGLFVSVGLFVLALLLGLELLPEAEPMGLMMAWVGLALAFLFSWTIGLVTDLQRSDAMSFKNLLHLPVSLAWVFLYNYLSSFVSLSVAIFLPAMIGLCLAMIIVHGPVMLLSFPLLAGFFGMVTGLTYQLRGWLARLMENKRRGRNIVAAVTVAFVLLAQVPNLINLSVQRSTREERRAERQELRELSRVASEEGPEQEAAIAELARRDEQEQQFEARLERNVTLGTVLVPVGWLPYGVRASFEGKWFQGSLCALGMFSIGAWSLRRSFRTTMRSVVGGDGAVAVAAAASASPRGDPETAPADGRARKTIMVERELPFASDSVAGIAWAGQRALLRAPEAKLMLLGPVIILALYAVVFSKPSARESMSAFAPALSLGAIFMGLLSIIQLLQNQFGLDRGGFRAYVLSPVPRDQILLGKNLSTAPLGLGIGLVALIVLQVSMPSDTSHFLGGVLQLLSAYMLLCLVGNLMSILSPMRLKEGGLKAANAKLRTIVWQFLSLLLVPLVLSPLMLPSALEFFLGRRDWARHLPLYLLLHAAGLACVALFYRWMLRRQGELLQDREQHILDVLTRD